MAQIPHFLIDPSVDTTVTATIRAIDRIGHHDLLRGFIQRILLSTTSFLLATAQEDGTMLVTLTPGAERAFDRVRLLAGVKEISEVERRRRMDQALKRAGL